jgi:hypothetical protein
MAIGWAPIGGAVTAAGAVGAAIGGAVIAAGAAAAAIGGAVTAAADAASLDASVVAGDAHGERSAPVADGAAVPSPDAASGAGMAGVP